MTIHTALLQGQQLLEEAGIAAPRLTAEVLLAHAVGHDRGWLYAHSDDELREVWWIHYGRYLHQRLQGQPTQQITGVQEFYGRDFRVTPRCSDPAAGDRARHRSRAEVGRAEHRRYRHGIGRDRHHAGAGNRSARGGHRYFDRRAARRRGERPQARCDSRVAWPAISRSALRGGSFDLVVSNPPYVPARDKTTLQREVRDYEPEVALYGGDDGLEIYRRLIPEAERLLVPGGWLVMEIGYALGDAVSDMLVAWKEVEIRNDLAGLPRVIVGPDGRETLLPSRHGRVLRLRRRTVRSVAQRQTGGRRRAAQ